MVFGISPFEPWGKEKAKAWRARKKQAEAGGIATNKAIRDATALERAERAEKDQIGTVTPVDERGSSEFSAAFDEKGRNVSDMGARQKLAQMDRESARKKPDDLLKKMKKMGLI